MTARSPIPTNIITGFLGVGKTTALNQLIAQKPADETWAIVVNEFGKVGVDQTLLEDTGGLAIKEIAGGCVCCALGPALTINLAMLLRRTQPDRLIIEPTGLGHPEGLIDILQGESFKDALQLHAIICLIDPRVLDQPKVLQHPTFMDQINLADILVLNKCDLADSDHIAKAKALSEQMFPPKAAVLTTESGQFPLDLLDLQHSDRLHAEFPDAHQHNHRQSAAALPPIYLSQPGHPVRLTGSSAEAHSAGWVFHSSERFNHDKLLALLSGLPNVWRIKGVFNLGHCRVFYNRIGSEITHQPIAWRRDSRVEIIAKAALDWDQIEAQLQQTLQPAIETT